MKNTTLSICLLALKLTTAQQIVFTTKNVSNEDVFWKVNVNTPFIYQNITDSLNLHALYSGIHKGPICSSHNGNYYVFQSERFANNIGGYEAITIGKKDFSYFEVPMDSAGNAFHSEGIMQISNDGKSIYFTQGGGTHNRDIYKITKGISTWSTPVELTTNSTYLYNLSPYLSYDESTILFESSTTSAYSVALNEVLVTGVGLNNKTSNTAIPNCTQVKSPCYDVTGNIYFEAETDAERIWKINSTGGAPVVVNNSFTNDNSPVTLPDGKIASLYLPGSTHQIKIMGNDGLNDFMLTSSTSSFDEVFDIGISAGGDNTTSIKEENAANTELIIFPNPNNGLFSVKANIDGFVSVTVFNSIGENTYRKTYSKWLDSQNFDLSLLPTGIYIVKVENNGMFFTKRFFISK